jgi:hypothetical protein
MSLFCPAHRHLVEMYLEDLHACPACLERIEDYYRQAQPPNL